MEYATLTCAKKVKTRLDLLFGFRFQYADDLSYSVHILQNGRCEAVAAVCVLVDLDLLLPL